VEGRLKDGCLVHDELRFGKLPGEYVPLRVCNTKSDDDTAKPGTDFITNGHRANTGDAFADGTSDGGDAVTVTVAQGNFRPDSQRWR